MGVCYPEDCPDDLEFVFTPDEGITVDNYFYRCKFQKDESATCYLTHPNGNKEADCYQDSIYCMSIFSDTVYYGLCDASVCDEFTDSAGNESTYTRFPYPGCLFEADGYVCTLWSDRWFCFKNATLCGGNCTEPQNCGDCKTNTCLSGYVWNETNERCENDTSYCIVRTNDTSWNDCYYSGSGDDSSSEADDLGCFHRRVSPVGIYWSAGTGSDLNKGMRCAQNDDQNGKWVCWYNQKLCGYRCEGWNGTNCEGVYLPQCAKEGYCPQTGYDMSEGCLCEGAVTSSGGKQYCCSVGHLYLNGGCTMIDCGERYVGNGGICVDRCPNFVSDGICVDTCPDGQIANKDNLCE